jgi:hypothetical protein
VSKTTTDQAEEMQHFLKELAKLIDAMTEVVKATK